MSQLGYFIFSCDEWFGKVFIFSNYRRIYHSKDSATYWYKQLGEDFGYANELVTDLDKAKELEGLFHEWAITAQNKYDANKVKVI